MKILPLLSQMANELAILEEGRKRWGSGILLGHDSTTVEDISEYVHYKTVASAIRLLWVYTGCCLSLVVIGVA